MGLLCNLFIGICYHDKNLQAAGRLTAAENGLWFMELLLLLTRLGFSNL
jgi:hypothetical protein